MVITLDEAKLYLRVEGDDENALITNFIESSSEICEGILRFPLTEFTEMPETIKLSMLYSVSKMYEERENFDVKALHDVLVRLLFSYRKESW